MRFAPSRFVVLMLLALTASADAGILETSDPDAFIRGPTNSWPSFLLGDTGDFSLLCWLRRDQNGTGTSNVLRAADFSVRLDDDDDVVRFSLVGDTVTVEAVVPTPAGVPLNEWMLLACRWERTPGRLMAWVASPSLGIVTSSAEDPAWSGGLAWPWRIGADESLPGFSGQFGMLTLREDLVDDDDITTIWNDGAPGFHGPARLAAGGLDGVARVLGHGVVNYPNKQLNSAGQGSRIDGEVNEDRILYYTPSSSYYAVGKMVEVSGAWTFRSPHDTDEPWGHFFVRDIPDLGIGDPIVSRVSPNAAALAAGSYEGPLRVVASANSRGWRTNRSYDAFENWGLGGLWKARRAETCGVMIPAWPNSSTSWPFLPGAARVEGTVKMSHTTTDATIAFGNFGTFGDGNPAFPGYSLGGRAAFITDGSRYIPKARPEVGSRFDSITDPVTVRCLLLSFPGSGDAVHEGWKATAQGLAGISAGDTPTTLPLDTTIASHTLSASDTWDTRAAIMTLDGVIPGLEAGMACYLASGAGEGGITIIETLDVDGGTTTMQFEHWLPVDPDVGTELRFGPVEAIWVERVWTGSDPDDPNVYRGLRVTASGGPVVVIMVDAFNHEADGLVIGSWGAGGSGYQKQLLDLFDSHGVALFGGLQADVWLQFFAHQGSSVTSMASWADAIRAQSPATEIWWCGDPDLDTTTNNVESTDAWHPWILANAKASEVGAVTAHQHPDVGTGYERMTDGQVADQSHPSGRGCSKHVEATLDLIGQAALPASCPSDVDGNGDVGVDDVLAILAAWGSCPGCASDLDDDGVVGVDDLLIILAAWGACP